MSKQDIRITTDFPDHPKVVKLVRRLGEGAVRCLLRLWGWARVNRPDGVLSNVDSEDLIIAAGWNGDANEFIAAMENLGFLDRDKDGTWCLHNWAEYQGWACGQEKRSQDSTYAALVKHYGQEVALEKIRQTHPDYAPGMRPGCDPDAGGKRGACDVHAVRNAPIPLPTPSPAQKAPNALVGRNSLVGIVGSGEEDPHG